MLKKIFIISSLLSFALFIVISAPMLQANEYSIPPAIRAAIEDFLKQFPTIFFDRNELPLAGPLPGSFFGPLHDDAPEFIEDNEFIIGWETIGQWPFRVYRLPIVSTEAPLVYFRERDFWGIHDNPGFFTSDGSMITKAHWFRGDLFYANRFYLWNFGRNGIPLIQIFFEGNSSIEYSRYSRMFRFINGEFVELSILWDMLDNQDNLQDRTEQRNMSSSWYPWWWYSFDDENNLFAYRGYYFHYEEIMYAQLEFENNFAIFTLIANANYDFDLNEFIWNNHSSNKFRFTYEGYPNWTWIPGEHHRNGFFQGYIPGSDIFITETRELWRLRYSLTESVTNYFAQTNTTLPQAMYNSIISTEPSPARRIPQQTTITENETPHKCILF